MIGKKYSLILVSFFSLLLLSSATFAPIYTWVDENGRKHFGDKIPAKYQSNSEAVELKEVNTASLRESSNSIADVLGDRNTEAPAKEKEHEAPEEIDAPSKQTKEKKSECSVQFAKYKESQRCYSSCINAGGGINKSKCSHCTDIPRPRCNLVY